jgi:hypothetical protein
MIRPRDASTDFIAQDIRGPPNRYCMLHFWHGYAPGSPDCPDQSALVVALLNTTNAASVFHSLPTLGPGAALHEEWLRLLTPGSGGIPGPGAIPTLLFGAMDTSAGGNCGVLLDDVSFECAVGAP